MMKKIVKAVIALSILPIMLFSSCKTSAEKEEAAKDNVNSANENLASVQAEVKADALLAEEAAEFKIIKAEAEMKIKKNEQRIAELRAIKITSGKIKNDQYVNKIDSLERKNIELETRITEYEESHSNWNNFKTEFNKDMDALGVALNDLFTKEKK